MANRVFYAVQQVGIASQDTNSFVPIHGLQSVGMTTSFNLEQIFEIGQIEIYENIENLPEIEMTLEKVLDGYCPMYLLATDGAVSTTLAGRSARKCSAALSIFDDAQDSASGTPTAEISCSGMFIATVGYNFPVEGNSSENISLVGNNKLSRTTGFLFTGQFDNTDSPLALDGSGGVNRREDFLWEPSVDTLDVNGQIDDPNCSVMPGGTNGIPGITSSGTNPSTAGIRAAHIQGVAVSTDFGRTDIFELGRKTPFYKYANFPIEVSCDITFLTTAIDNVSATEAGVISPGVNLVDKSIRVAIREGLRLNLGTKNKLSNVSYGGADTGGGNAEVTHTYTNFNSLSVGHANDITTALRLTAYIPPSGT